MNPARASLFAILSLSLWLAACNLAPGGGTDVGNPDVAARVSGSIRHVDGTPAAFVNIHLRPKGFVFDPQTGLAITDNTSQDGFSDTQGFFTFDSVPKGDYRIEAIDTVGHGAVLEVSPDGHTEHVTVAPLIVDSVGWISGNVSYRGPPQPISSKIIIAVYGMIPWTYAILGGDFTLSNLPPGTYTLKISTAAADTLSTVVSNVQVTAGGRTSVGTVDLGP